VHADFPAARTALERDGPRRWFAFTTRGSRSLYEARFAPGDVLVFGCETAGLAEESRCVSGGSSAADPMRPGVRSLNLSNAVAVAVYEAWRQTGLVGAA